MALRHEARLTGVQSPTCRLFTRQTAKDIPQRQWRGGSETTPKEEVMQPENRTPKSTANITTVKSEVGVAAERHRALLFEETV